MTATASDARDAIIAAARESIADPPYGVIDKDTPYHATSANLASNAFTLGLLTAAEICGGIDS
jgi:hypothetical protein